MKTVIRNFYSILNRFRMATTLNIIGLSIAFAAFLLLMMQVLHVNFSPEPFLYFKNFLKLPDSFFYGIRTF